MKTSHSTTRCGFTLIDLLLIVTAVIVLAMIALPKLIHPDGRVPRVSCANNLTQVSIAFRVWAGDNNDKTPMQVSVTNGGAMELTEGGSVYAAFLVMSNELNTPKILFCPEDLTPQRRMASTFAPTVSPNANAGVFPFTETNSISYFIGLDATDTEPQRILIGDDHFLVAGVRPKPGLLLLQSNTPVEWQNERHPKHGNVALAYAYGVVQNFSTRAFRQALLQTGMATNRLAMP